MITIVLVEPEWASNLGSVARVMANFGYKDLVLINPKCKKDDFDAIKNSKHGLAVLKSAKVKNFSYLKTFDYLVATTSKISSDYNILRTPVSSRSMKIPNGKNVAILFGREGDGLYNEELKMCDYLVTIPTHKSYPALNISHSVAIILYELSKNKKNVIGDTFAPVGKKEKEHLITLVNKILAKMSFPTKEKKETQEILWKRIIGSSFLTKREAFALFGFFRRIK